MTISEHADGRVGGVDSEVATIVSNDSHIGPSMKQLRSYCPDRYLGDFDDFARASDDAKIESHQHISAMIGDPRYVRQLDRCQLAAGHNDIEGRLRDMDRDGIAAEVVFHGSANYEPLPFIGAPKNQRHVVSGFDSSRNDLELAAVGYRMYNRWLVDALSVAASRFIGLAQIPVWDLDAAVAEMEWAAINGMRGISFPAPREPLPEYDDPHWEPLWAAAERLGLVLATHSGAGGWPSSGPQARSIFLLEVGGWLSRRGMHRMIFGGVFERHRGLKLVLTEQMGGWWTSALRDMDSAWQTNAWLLRDLVPRRPSDYAATNVFVGASMMANFEAAMAVDDGYVDNMLWGRDYPHPEGSWQYRDEEDDTDITRLSLRHAFGGIDKDAVAKMVGANAIRVFSLDAAHLADIAKTIGAPTIRELTIPLDELPSTGSPLAFRTMGAWG